jgi:peptidoglycan/LPS O-acetylase OafA/YrhL
MIAAPLTLWATSAQGMGSAPGSGFLRAIYGFSVGALLYVLSFRPMLFRHAASGAFPGSRYGSVLWTAIEVSVTALAVLFAWTTHANPLSYGLPFVFALLVWVFAWERGAVSRLLRLRPFILVGRLSYSIYMVHMFIQLRLLNVARLLDFAAGTSFVRQVGRTGRYGGGIDLGSLFAGDLLIVVTVAVTIAASYVTYRLIERPGQRAFRHLADRLFGPAGRHVEIERGPLQPALT